MPLKIEYLKVDGIATYDRNARIHSPEQVEQIVASIQEFGFTNPVLIDGQGELIAGHGRLAAAEQIGLEEVPAIRLENLTEKQVKALRIADNQLALNASWDLDLLSAELMDLDGEEFNMELLGFDDDFLNGLLDDDFGDDLGDGHDDDGPDGANDDAANVAVVVGPYRFDVKRRSWDKWETAIRAKVGFDKEDIQKEMQRRLGFD